MTPVNKVHKVYEESDKDNGLIATNPKMEHSTQNSP